MRETDKEDREAMQSYKKVLIAVDLSENSKAVINRAEDLFANVDVELHLVHVIVPVVGDYSFELSLSDYDDFQHAHQRAVGKELAKLIEDTRLQIPEERIHLLSGHVAKELHGLVNEIGIDLLVIGSHGYGAVMSVLGSTTNAVLHNIKCDALTVRI